VLGARIHEAVTRSVAGIVTFSTIEMLK